MTTAGKKRKGIPTTGSDGTRFRSRLESRWATFFDLIGWRWEYEPFDADGYVPDFAILGELPLLVEVKPALHTRELADYVEKAQKTKRDLLIVGGTPVLGSQWDWYATAGVMVQWGECDDETYASDADALWHHCLHPDCGGVAVHHSEQCFQSYPCGHYEGDHYLGPLDTRDFNPLWAQARNSSQWSPR